MPVLEESETHAVFGIGTRMAVLVADPVRARILAEIGRQPLSPSEFVNTVGGDIGTIGRGFRQLERWGYTEIAEERPGRRGGASVEHVYVPVPQPLELPAWERIVRRGSPPDSAGMFFAQVKEAFDQGTLDRDLDRHLSYDEILLDSVGWGEVAARQSELLEWLPELEREVAERAGEENHEPIPAIVGLSLFRAGYPAARILRTSLEEYPPALSRGNRFQLCPTMTKALSNPWRSRILAEMTTRPMSPSQFAEEVGGDASYIARCFRELAEWELIELVEERAGGRRGGGVERIYRNVQRMFIDAETWQRLPPFFRTEVSASLIRNYVRRIEEAIGAGTFDTDPDRVCAWKRVVLDRRGWRDLARQMDAAMFRAPEVGRESVARTAGNPDRLVPAVIGMAAFRAATPAL
ncbi:MAG TPA: winged helix-turn-helix domain-containing protein [Solirubrobacterales bacterium]|nr:winged helix-turn-helix domain-containing protein [Solirubrobacterales bacterium]